ncbi:MAG: methyl-accepting chemotaxis protein [Pseudomonadota bacterium]
MNFRNLKVGQRLGLSFGLILALLLILASLALSRLNGMNDEIRLTNEDRYPKTVLAHTIKDELNEITQNMDNLLLMREAGQIKKELANIEQSTAIVKTAIEKLERTMSSPAGRDNLKALFDARQKFLAARSIFLALAAADKKDEARDYLLGPLRTVYQAYFAALDKVIVFHEGEMNEAATTAAGHARETTIVVVSLSLAALVSGVLIALAATRSITRPLGKAVEVARRVAEGRLDSVIEVHSQDETGQLLAALRDMNTSLQEIVGKVRSGTELIATASREIAGGNLDLSARTEQQASSLEETASSMEELTSTVKQNSDNARQANVLAASASEVAVRGGSVVQDVVQTMVSINASSKRIVDIIGVIDGIAFQTNILALNAAVEAARAGEQGRGFAVVASEVRNLAQRSAAAAKEIKGLIDDSVARVDAGCKLVNQAGHTMDDIVASVTRVTDIMGEIASASQQQEAGIEQINQAIAEMDTVTQQNAALVEQAAAATSSLQDQASSLIQAVAAFTLAAAPARVPARAPARPARSQRRLVAVAA